MDKIKVIVSKDWAGAPNADTPVLIFELPFPEFGEKDPLTKQRTIRIVKRTLLGPVDGLAQALTFLPASLTVPGFTMEMFQADVFSWHELVNEVHAAQFLMASIDETFQPGMLVEKDDLCRDAVEDALGTDEFDLTIMKGAEGYWEQLDPCESCPNDGSCLAQDLE
jgi:hypothetical protein